MNPSNLKTFDDLKKLTDVEIESLEKDLIAEFPTDPVFSVSTTGFAPGVQNGGYLVAEHSFDLFYRNLTGDKISGLKKVNATIYYLGAASKTEFKYGNLDVINSAHKTPQELISRFTHPMNRIALSMDGTLYVSRACLVSALTRKCYYASYLKNDKKAIKFLDRYEMVPNFQVKPYVDDRFHPTYIKTYKAVPFLLARYPVGSFDKVKFAKCNMCAKLKPFQELVEGGCICKGCAPNTPVAEKKEEKKEETDLLNNYILSVRTDRNNEFYTDRAKLSLRLTSIGEKIVWEGDYTSDGYEIQFLSSRSRDNLVSLINEWKLTGHLTLKKINMDTTYRLEVNGNLHGHCEPWSTVTSRLEAIGGKVLLGGVDSRREVGYGITFTSPLSREVLLNIIKKWNLVAHLQLLT